MNKTIRRASVFSLLLVLALLVRATWVQFYDGRALADDKNNRRNVIEQYAYPLGDIIVGGEAVTGSKRTGDGSDLAYKRTYTDGELYAAVTGYSSQVYGATQLEGIYQDLLDGTDTRLKNPSTRSPASTPSPATWSRPSTRPCRRPRTDALGDKKGAAVAIDPKTGKILGSRLDPVVRPVEDQRIGPSTDGKAWTALTKDKDKPMLNRALRAAAAAGLHVQAGRRGGRAGGRAVLVGGREDRQPEPVPAAAARPRVLKNENASAPCENATIRTALQYSCNNVFGKMAVDLGQDKVRAMAEKFGFNDAAQDMPVRAYESVYPKDMDKAQTAPVGHRPVRRDRDAAADGDGRRRRSPTAASWHRPHMVSQVTDADGNALKNYADGRRPSAWSARRRPRSSQSAMATVVEQGTGTNAQIAGATVGGKTGTAQHGENNSKTPYAWFTSYAKDDSTGKEVAVAVVVEQSDAARSEVSGNGLAAPIAKAMMSAALKG